MGILSTAQRLLVYERRPTKLNQNICSEMMKDSFYWRNFESDQSLWKNENQLCKLPIWREHEWFSFHHFMPSCHIFIHILIDSKMFVIDMASERLSATLSYAWHQKCGILDDIMMRFNGFLKRSLNNLKYKCRLIISINYMDLKWLKLSTL